MAEDTRTVLRISGDVAPQEGDVPRYRGARSEYAPEALPASPGGGGGGSGFVARGPWATATVYAADDVVTHDGQTYRVATGHTSSSAPPEAGSATYELWAAKGAEGDPGAPGSPGADGADGADGRGFNPRGAWTTATVYALDDLVTSAGQTFRVASAHTSSTAPPEAGDATYELWAKKGADGSGGGTSDHDALSNVRPVDTASADATKNKHTSNLLEKNGVDHQAAAAPHPGHEVKSAKGQTNGYGSLDANGKQPLSEVNAATLGANRRQGTWDATTAAPASGLGNNDTDRGKYWEVGVAGTTLLGGKNDWQPGDYLIWEGLDWGFVDNTDRVGSVFGRSGAVVAVSGDYAASQIAYAGAAGMTATDVEAAIDELAPHKLYVGTTLPVAPHGYARSYNPTTRLEYYWDGAAWQRKTWRYEFAEWAIGDASTGVPAVAVAKYEHPLPDGTIYVESVRSRVKVQPGATTPLSFDVHQASDSGTLTSLYTTKPSLASTEGRQKTHSAPSTPSFTASDTGLSLEVLNAGSSAAQNLVVVVGYRY